MPVSLEHAMYSLITGFSAFTTLTPAPTVRPYKIAETDFRPGTGARAVIIECPEQEHEVDLDGRGGAVSATVNIMAIAETFDDAWTVAEVMRTNGTNPGTGLSGFSGAVATLTIQRISVDKTKNGFAEYQDGSDEGFYYCLRELTVDYTETF